MKCRALINSRSQVTSISHSYWLTHLVLQGRRLTLSKIPIEGAAGQSVPYYGVLDIELGGLGKQ